MTRVGYHWRRADGRGPRPHRGHGIFSGATLQVVCDMDIERAKTVANATGAKGRRH